MSSMEWADSGALLASSKPAISGASTVPSRFDVEALHNAAGTLPPAIDVKAIDAWMVDGSALSRINPAHNGGDSSPGAEACKPTTSSGNSTNVLRKITACSRQWRRPATAASGASRAPCMKNSSMMAALVTQAATSPASPRAGATEASATVSRMAARKGSIRESARLADMGKSLRSQASEINRSAVIVNVEYIYYGNRDS